VNEPEDVAEDFCVVRILLEANQLDVNDIDALVRLGEKLPQQVVHKPTLSTQRPAVAPAHVGGLSTLLVNGLILVVAPQILGGAR
jgi:hypothetical protein